MKAIEVKNLSKEFLFPVKDEKASWLGNLMRPQSKIVQAVDSVSFSVSAGERLAFIGPNGAGKSTTIKMLTGILHPSAGTISVLGLDPTKERQKLAYRIGTVFGQRSQLFPNLPVRDSLEFFGAMYDLSQDQIKLRSAELEELFELGEFRDQPVRKLSLGQRMRAEVAASLVHNPEIVFLDEPTIGLDVVAKKSLRELLIKINQEQGTTIFLTSHDVSDIEALCERTIVVNHGRIINDLPTSELSKSFGSEKYVDIVYRSMASDLKLPTGVRLAENRAGLAKLIIDLTQIGISSALEKILPYFDVEDIDIYNVDLETVIRKMYETKAD